MRVRIFLIPIFTFFGGSAFTHQAPDVVGVAIPSTSVVVTGSRVPRDTGIEVRAGDSLTFSVQRVERGIGLKSGNVPYLRVGEQDFPLRGEPPITMPGAGRVLIWVPRNEGYDEDFNLFRVVLAVRPAPRDGGIDPKATENAMSDANVIATNAVEPLPDPTPDDSNISSEASDNAMSVEVANENAVLDDNGPDTGGTGDGRDRGWVYLLIAAGVTIVLFAGGNALRRRARFRRTVAMLAIHSSLDLRDGAVAGDEIGLAGPETRLGVSLEDGGVRFEGDEPIGRPSDG